MNIGQKAAETIGEKPISIKIGESTYTLCRPTIRTMIEVSRLIGLYPSIKLEKGHEINSLIKVAKDVEPLGMIVATLILGYYKCGIKEMVYKWKINRLAQKILNQHTCKEIAQALVELLARLEIVDFFGITTSLSEINLTKITKEVG